MWKQASIFLLVETVLHCNLLWSYTQIEIRKDETGEVLFRDTFNSPISAILEADYKGHGSNQVMVCSEDGEVRGYMPLDAQQEDDGTDLSAKKEALEKFNQKKQAGGKASSHSPVSYVSVRYVYSIYQLAACCHRSSYMNFLT